MDLYASYVNLPINRTIFGIEMYSTPPTRGIQNLSIAPSLELKFEFEMAAAALELPINRTIFGIEIGLAVFAAGVGLNYQSHHLWN